jgi:predicted N-acetyltransferase YhbS
MDAKIRPIRSSDIPDVVELSLLAFYPIHLSFRQILGSDLYESIWPDWKAGYRKDLPEMSKDDGKYFTFVAECDNAVVGFVSYTLDSKSSTGTTQIMAVHPDHQCKGIGTELNVFALNRIREAGMKMAIVETGGDESHLPARISYEKAGYTGLPLVRYFKKL